MNRLRQVLLCGVLGGLWLPATSAWAQESLAGCIDWNRISQSAHQISENHLRFTGDVEIVCDKTKFYADEMDVFTDTNIIVATGNITFISEDSQVNADRMEFNTKTRTGVFYHAFGTSTLTAVKERSLFGTQEPLAYFWGEELHKLGPDRYRIKKGGFTTCVQPTPRWEIDSDDVTLTINHYALARNPVLKVKGVPLFYAPVIYYPINKEDRATGFLLPTYGTSTLRGPSLSTAFFWAIDRSQDATFYDDWFMQKGQGLGAEYRYVSAPGSNGNVSTYLLDERASQTAAGTPVSAHRSYKIVSSVTQALPGRLHLRANVDYFSDLATQQYYYNIYNASQRQRTYGANITGAFGPYLLNTTLNRNEVFYGTTSSTVVGTMPRVALSRSERPIENSPIYVSVSSEYSSLLRKSLSGDTVRDNGLQRVDVVPAVRVPFTHWPFLTVNTSLAWRGTYWTQSLNPQGQQVNQGISRRYLDFRSQVTGPTFNRIWDRPKSQYARKIKHVIEPSLTFQRTSAIDIFNQIVRLDGVDTIVGNVTQFAYALTNRLYIKPSEGGETAPPREILNVAVSQSYYTDANAAKYDPNYATSFTGVARSNFTPVAVTARANPTAQTSGQFRAEYDTQFHAFRSFSANGSVALGDRLQATGGWSQQRYVAGFSSPGQQSHFINGATTLRFKQGRVGGTYAFNYDLFHGYFLQKRLIAYYNAQCCGFGVEYQVYNFLTPDPRTGLSYDRRFNVSFTLAGVGSFSNLLGAFGGNQNPR